MGAVERGVVLGLLGLMLLGVSLGQENANPTIPDRLLPCYRNQTIYNRENRMPMDIRTLVDLIRLIENSKTGKNMDARQMSLALGYFLRLDGIQVSPEIIQSDAVVPFAPAGTEYYKHRITLIKLLSKPSRDDDDFLFENLDQEQICNIHFMLSYSIDSFKRPAENCNMVQTEMSSRRETYPSRPGYQPGNQPGYQPGNQPGNQPRNQPGYQPGNQPGYQPVNNPGYYPGRPGYQQGNQPGRPDYQPGYQPDRPNYQPGYQPDQQSGQWHYQPNRPGQGRAPRNNREADRIKVLRKEQRHIRKSRHALKKAAMINRLEEKIARLEQRRARRHRREAEEEDKDHEIEVIPPKALEVLAVNSAPEEEKSADFTIGKNKLVGQGLEHPMRGGMEDSTQRKTYSAVEKRMLPPRYQTNVPPSDCPVENGVIRTPSGSVTIGNVIAGIAAGLNPQDISPQELNVRPELWPGIGNTRVNNLWATTLSGNVAEMILSMASAQDFNQAVGLKGGWDDITNPKWYLLSSKNSRYLTDVELRGALDGLWLGSNVNNWAKRMNQLKLSQILDTYYIQAGGGIDPRVKGCNRQMYYNEYVDTQKFKDQVNVFTVVLFNQRISEVTYTDFTNFTDMAVRNVQNYISSLDKGCEQSGDLNGPVDTTKADVNTNLVTVIDSAWEPAALARLLRVFALEEVAATPFQSTLTIMCGSSGDILAVLKDSTSITTEFIQSIYTNCSQTGVDFYNFKYSLETFYRQIYSNERTKNIIDTDTQVTLILPVTALANVSVTQDNSPTDDFKRLFESDFPDVRVMVATTGSRDSWNSLVKDPANDVFTITTPTPSNPSSTDSIKLVAKSVKKMPHRLTKAKCGSYFSYEDGDSTTRENIQLGLTKYYRMLPNYLYTVGSGDGAAKITVRALRPTKLTVCWYRTDPQANGGTPNNPPQNPSGTPNNPSYPPQNPGSPAVTVSPPSYRLGMVVDNRDTGSSGCKTGSTEGIIIDLIDPCSGAGSLKDCQPLYVTVTAQLESGDANIAATCTTDCRFPTNVEYDIVAVGLKCERGGVGAAIVSPLLILACLLLRQLNLI